MTLDALRTFARRQLAHYAELVKVLDKIAVDPLSVVPQEERRARRPRLSKDVRKALSRRPSRKDLSGPAPAASPTAAAYAVAALRALGPASTADVVAHARRAGWDTISDNPQTVMHITLKHLAQARKLKKKKLAGRRIAWALPTLKGAVAKANDTPAPTVQ